MRARSQSQSETASNNSTNISLQRSYIQQKKIKSIQQIMNKNYGGNTISSQSIGSQSKSSQNSFNTHKNNDIQSQASNQSIKNNYIDLNKNQDKEDYSTDQNLYYISNMGNMNQIYNNRYECDRKYNDDQLELKNRSFSSNSQNEINTKRVLQDSYSNLNTIEDYQKLIPDSINISYNFGNQSQNNQINNQIKRSDINDYNKENTFINNNLLQQNILHDKQNKQKNFHANSNTNYLSSNNSFNINNMQNTSNLHIKKQTNLNNNQQNNDYINQKEYDDSMNNKDSDQCYPVKKNHLLLLEQKQNNKQSIKQSNKSNHNMKSNTYQKSQTVERNSFEKIQKQGKIINNSKKVQENKEKRNQSSHQGSSSSETVSYRHLNLSQQSNYGSLQKISKYLNKSLVELNSQRNEQQYRNSKNILYHSLNQNQIDEYIKDEQAKEFLRQNQYSEIQDVSREHNIDKKYLYQNQGSNQAKLSESLPLDILSNGLHESTDKEVLIKMREIIHQLQSRDATHRLEISKLKKSNQELKDALQSKQQEKQSNEYQIQKDGEYIRQLDSEINQFQQKVNSLQKQLAEEQNKYQNVQEEKNEIIDQLQHENNQLRIQIQQLIENQQDQLQKIEMYQYMDQYQNKIEEQNEINLSNIDRSLHFGNISNSSRGGNQLINSDEEQDIMSTSSLNNSMKLKERMMLMQTQNINFQNNNINNGIQNNTLEATCNYFPNEEDIIREQAEEDEQSERSQYNQGFRAPSSSQRGSSDDNTSRSQKYDNLSEQNIFLNPAKNINVNLQSLIQLSKQNSSQSSNKSQQQQINQQKQNNQQYQNNSGKNNSIQSSLNNSMSLREQINKKCNNFFQISTQMNNNNNNSKFLSIQSPNGQLLPLDSSVLYKQQAEKREMATANALTPSQVCVESNKVMTNTTQMNISFSSPPSSCSSTFSNDHKREFFLKNVQQENQNILQEKQIQNLNQINFTKQSNQSNGISGNYGNILQPISSNIAQFKQQHQENKSIQNFDFKSYFQSLNKNENTNYNSQNPFNNNVDSNQQSRKQNVFVQSNTTQQNVKKSNVFSSKNNKENQNPYFINESQIYKESENKNHSLQQENNNQQISFDKKNQQIPQQQFIDNFESRKVSISSKSSSDQDNQFKMNEQILKNYNSQQSNKDGLDIDPYQFITEEMTNNTNSECRYNEDCNQDGISQNENQNISLSYKNSSENDELSQGISNQSNNDFGEIQGELTEEQTQEILRVLKQKLESEYTFDDDLLEQMNQQ